jgi:hypothetical protein
LIEHENEPIPGLPALLPVGETILWQGAPSWRPLARRAFHLGQVGLYLGALLVWAVVAGHGDGASVGDALIGAARVVPLALAVLVILGGLAWLTARTTLYTITNRRVVMRCGVALPVTWNLPFAVIDSAGLKAYADQTGDLSLLLKAGEKISYLVLWPHVRPWRITRPEPTLRGIPEVAAVAQILGRALAAASDQPAPVVPQIPVSTGASPQAATAAY